MQHHSILSPLLDFTSDIDVGLYFAFSFPNLEGKNDAIENYVSLYVINIEANKDFLLIKKDDDLKFESSYKERKLVLFTEVTQNSISENSSVFKGYTNTNFNIINQKGLFLIFILGCLLKELELIFKTTHF